MILCDASCCSGRCSPATRCRAPGRYRVAEEQLRSNPQTPPAASSAPVWCLLLLSLRISACSSRLGPCTRVPGNICITYVLNK